MPSSSGHCFHCPVVSSDQISRARSGRSDCCNMGRTVWVYKLRYREKRERKGKTQVIYEREVCPLQSNPASGQLHIHATQTVEICKGRTV